MNRNGNEDMDRDWNRDRHRDRDRNRDRYRDEDNLSSIYKALCCCHIKNIEYAVAIVWIYFNTGLHLFISHCPKNRCDKICHNSLCLSIIKKYMRTKEEEINLFLKNCIYFYHLDPFLRTGEPYLAGPIIQ